jgi:hypothetical protein
MNRYLTVFNKLTHKSVPFIRNQFNEIIINSVRPEDADENCIVTLSSTFMEFSQDTEFTQRIIN